MTRRRASGVFLCLSLAAGTVAIAAAAEQPGAKAPAPQPPKVAESADWAARAAAFGELEWITRPSRDATMSFTLPVEIREIPAQPGQRVKAGDLLVRARDADIVAAVESQRVRVGNSGPVDAAKAAVDSASTRYQRIIEASNERATNQQEVDDRRVQLDAARAQLTNAENEHKEEVAKLKQMEESLARYRLQAPFDGVVESVVVDSGSSIEPPNPVLRIVNIDVLWIELPTPTDLTLSKDLKAGAPAWVLLDVPGGWVAQGEVLYVSPVADAAAATRRVRVSVPNPKQLPPGTRARVRFDKPDGFVADGSQSQGGGAERAAAGGSGEKK